MRDRGSGNRVNSEVHSDFFERFVFRYADRQYQTWVGGGLVAVGVNYTYDPQLLDKVGAAIVSHYTNLSYSSALKYRNAKQRVNRIPDFEQLFDRVEGVFYENIERFLSGHRPNLDEAHGPLVNSEIFLLRLLASLRAARLLINWGYFLEPLTILRTGLEQLAWCHRVGTTFDVRLLDHPRPSKCIGVFQERYPAAGLLYGTLSVYSHFEFDAQKHFVASVNGIPGIMERSTEFKFFGLILYAFVMIAVEYTCRDFRDFYAKEYSLNFPLRNTVLPLKHLVSHAIFQPELDRDQIALIITRIFLLIFPQDDRRP
jgi:hypothetical protein